jgi:hypothetical protein
MIGCIIMGIQCGIIQDRAVAIAKATVDAVMVLKVSFIVLITAEKRKGNRWKNIEINSRRNLRPWKNGLGTWVESRL